MFATTVLAAAILVLASTFNGVLAQTTTNALPTTMVYDSIVTPTPTFDVFVPPFAIAPTLLPVAAPFIEEETGDTSPKSLSSGAIVGIIVGCIGGVGVGVM
ncbi:hypothetical protein SeLEV6574_g04306 [Synchytrium endobioticum]|uniref:Uncharacterized protein n=1 Tax=Synchytrium endobioticum TaxID=286115 RepID=A0A507CZY5_9FUNG|nr:hypothetical protein SeLEV6574_g04306 [Synchytrium endobioticum]